MQTLHSFNVAVNPAIIMALCSLIAMGVWSLGKVRMLDLKPRSARFMTGAGIAASGVLWYIVAIVVAINVGN